MWNIGGAIRIAAKVSTGSFEAGDSYCFSNIFTDTFLTAWLITYPADDARKWYGFSQYFECSRLVAFDQFCAYPPDIHPRRASGCTGWTVFLDTLVFQFMQTKLIHYIFLDRLEVGFSGDGDSF